MRTERKGKSPSASSYSRNRERFGPLLLLFLLSSHLFQYADFERRGEIFSVFRSFTPPSPTSMHFCCFFPPPLPLPPPPNTCKWRLEAEAEAEARATHKKKRKRSSASSSSSSGVASPSSSSSSVVPLPPPERSSVGREGEETAALPFARLSRRRRRRRRRRAHNAYVPSSLFTSSLSEHQNGWLLLCLLACFAGPSSSSSITHPRQFFGQFWAWANGQASLHGVQRRWAMMHPLKTNAARTK